jgi:hypothetical protein
MAQALPHSRQRGSAEIMHSGNAGHKPGLGQESCSPVQVHGRAPDAKHVPKSNGRTIEQLEDFRTLLQSVIDYNEPLLAQPGQQRAAARRIAEAKEQIQSLDGEMADLRG